MRKIIDSETGEIIELEEDNEIAERKLYEVGAIDENTADFIEQYLTLEEQFKTFKYILLKAMEDNGIKSWKNDYFTASIKEAGTQTRLDIDRLKEDGIYDKYLKLVPVNEGLTIRFKKGGKQ